MSKQKFPKKELLIITIGEVIVSLLVVAGFLIADLIIKDVVFSYKVITGAVLGSVVTIANYLFMILSVNKQVNRYIELRGNAEMDDEAAKKFASENSAPVQMAIARSFIIRTVTMIAALVVAFLLEWFDPIATVIPLLAFRPIITVGELLSTRLRAKGSTQPAALSDMSADTPIGESENDSLNEKESDE